MVLIICTDYESNKIHTEAIQQFSKLYGEIGKLVWMPERNKVELILIRLKALFVDSASGRNA